MNVLGQTYTGVHKFNMNFKKESIFKIEENIFFTELDNQICLFSSLSAEYLNLNSTASHVWKLIEKKFNFKEIIDDLTRSYDISQEKCTTEVYDLIKDLIKKEIITLN